MKLTVIIGNCIHAAHGGGPFTYRTVTIPLSAEQTRALQLDAEWEVIGQVVLEPEAPQLATEVSRGPA